jgi:hypothetical protein
MKMGGGFSLGATVCDRRQTSPAIKELDIIEKVELSKR